MASFWLSKKVLLEALKMSECLPQTTMIMFDGSSEMSDGGEITKMVISVRGSRKTIKENFNKLKLANQEYEFDD